MSDEGFSLDSLKESAQDVSESIERDAKTLCPWLPDPYQCDECGAWCDATTEYVAQQAMYCEVWSCPQCGSRYHRDRI